MTDEQPQDEPERTEYSLTKGEWITVPDTALGKARVTTNGNEGSATKCWLEESGYINSDGPATVDYFEA